MATIVLIHGAFQGGWIWGRVVPILRDAGHTVFAPTLDGCAERRHALRPGINTETHGTEIAELLFYQDLHDVVLAGTSNGGMVACCAAEQARERVGRIVLADALSLMNGESVADIVNRSNAVNTALTSGPSPEDARNRLFASFDPATLEWAMARYTQHPIGAMRDPVKLQRFWDLDWNATVVRCKQSVNPPLAHQRRAAEKLRAKWFELDTGHYPMVTEPEALARLIMA